MRVSQIYVYPIKSMRGISLSVSPASYTGLLYDRCFALVNAKTGKHLLVAENTEMCLFVTAFDVPYPEVPKKVVVTYTLDHIVGLPEQHVDRSTLEIDLLLDTHGMEEMVVEMNSSLVVGFCVGAVHDAWFSTRLGYEVRLLYIGNNRRKVLGNVPPSVAGLQRDELSRSKDKSWSDSITSLASTTISSLWGKSYEGEDHGLLFSDLAPFLIISATSCENAQRRLPEGERLDITKFRANIVVEGAEKAFEEDYWAELLLDSCNAKLILTQNCARCNSLNVDYDTGKVGQSGAGKLIKKLNSDRRVDRGIMKWNPVFGRYAFLAKLPPGKSFVDSSVSSEVTVIRKNDERTTLEWPF